MTRTPLRAAIVAALAGTAAIASSPALAQTGTPIPVTTLTPGTLTICTYPGFAPFTSFTSSGAWVGWDASFLTRFATQQGLAVKTVSVDPFDGMWKRPGEDQCDIAAAGIGNEPARRAQSPGTTWSITYYEVIRAFAVRKGSTLTGPQDLAGKTVIVTKDSTADQDIQQQIRQHHVKNVTVRYTDNEGAAVKMVSRGKVFAYGGGLGSIQYQAKRFTNIRVAWPHRILLPNGKRGTEPFSYPVRTADTGLIEALNAFIAANKASYGK